MSCCLALAIAVSSAAILSVWLQGLRAAWVWPMELLRLASCERAFWRVMASCELGRAAWNPLRRRSACRRDRSRSRSNSFPIKRLQYSKQPEQPLYSHTRLTMPFPRHNIMSELSSRQIRNAQRNPRNVFFLEEIHRSIYNNQQKLSRQVYNLETRDVRRFTREWEAMQKKMRGRDPEPSKSVTVQRGRRYDDNQLLELSFEGELKGRQTPPKATQRDLSAVAIRDSSRGNSSTRNVALKPALKQGFSFRINYVDPSRSRAIGLPRQKSNSLTHDRTAQRKRMATQWQLSPTREVKETQSRMSVVKGQPSTTYHASEDYIIDVTRDKMDRFVRNLHRLQWAHDFLRHHPAASSEEGKEFRSHMRRFEFDPDAPINEHAINFMVSRRYRLHTHYLEDAYEQRDRQLTEHTHSNQRKTLADPRQYPLLSQLATHSILGLLQRNLDGRPVAPEKRTPEEGEEEQGEVHFSLPHCEFISLRETKNSIYQLVGMSARMGLKLAFSIFDKNRNGLVDEDDLLQLISLSRTMPTLEIDIAHLAAAMLNQRDSKRSPRKMKGSKADAARQNRERNITNITTVTRVSKESEDRSFISPIEEERDSDEESEPNQKPLSNSRFSVDKLYSFLREREKTAKPTKTRANDTHLQPLNFLAFCKAYDHRRPYLLYDLFQFLFSATLADFKEHIRSEITTLRAKLQSNHAADAPREEEETLEEKWNQRLKASNAILQQFIRERQD